MLFLQSVTKHADKLKQTGESKVQGLFTYIYLLYYFGFSLWIYSHFLDTYKCFDISSVKSVESSVSLAYL